MFQRQVREKIKANISYEMAFSENHGLHEVRQRQVAAPDRLQLTAQLGREQIRFVCRIPNARTQTRIHNM